MELLWRLYSKILWEKLCGSAEYLPPPVVLCSSANSVAVCRNPCLTIEHLYTSSYFCFMHPTQRLGALTSSVCPRGMDTCYALVVFAGCGDRGWRSATSVKSVRLAAAPKLRPQNGTLLTMVCLWGLTPLKAREAVLY